MIRDSCSIHDLFGYIDGKIRRSKLSFGGSTRRQHDSLQNMNYVKSFDFAVLSQCYSLSFRQFSTPAKPPIIHI